MISRNLKRMQDVMRTLICVMLLLLMAVSCVTAASDIEQSKETATEVNLNTRISGALSSEDDVDMYKLTLTEESFLNIEFSHARVEDADYCWFVCLCDENLSSVGRLVISPRGVTEYYESQIVKVPAGTYYFKVSANEGHYSGVGYTAVIRLNEPCDYESEGNDKRDFADELTLNRPCLANGDTFSGDDVDWYMFRAPQDGYCSIEFDGGFEYGYNSDFKISFYTVNQYTGMVAEVYKHTYSSPDGSEKSVSGKIGILGGVPCYVKVSGNEKIQYKITVNYTEASDWEYEPNDDREYANEAGVNMISHGSASDFSDVDWYKISIPTERELAVTFNHNVSNDKTSSWLITLMKDDDVFLTVQSGSKTASIVSDYVKLPSGTYYLKLELQVGIKIEDIEYSFSVHEKHECAFDWKVIREATCTEDGLRENACSFCGLRKGEEPIPSVGHISTNWTVVEQVTCDKNGVRKGTCDVCAKYVVEEVIAPGHNLSEWEVIKGNVLIPPIVKERRCATCGRVETAEDWGYVWVTVVAAITAIGVCYGVISYFKAFKNN